MKARNRLKESGKVEDNKKHLKKLKRNRGLLQIRVRFRSVHPTKCLVYVNVAKPLFFSYAS